MALIEIDGLPGFTYKKKCDFSMAKWQCHKPDAMTQREANGLSSHGLVLGKIAGPGFFPWIFPMFYHALWIHGHCL